MLFLYYIVLLSKKVAEMSKLDKTPLLRKSKGVSLFVVYHKFAIYFSYIITEISNILPFVSVLSIPPYFSTVFKTLFNPRP